MIQEPLQVKIITLIIPVSTPRKTPFHVLAYVYGMRYLLILEIHKKKAKGYYNEISKLFQ